MIKVMARISSQSGAESSVEKILQDLIGPSRNEAGCQSYELFQDEENPLEFVTIEHWSGQAAVDAHMVTPHVAAAIVKAAPLLAQPPVTHRYTQIA
jgi:quinol monooxygenase YgiN